MRNRIRTHQLQTYMSTIHFLPLSVIFDHSVHSTPAYFVCLFVMIGLKVFPCGDRSITIYHIVISVCNKAKPSGTAHSKKPKNRTIQKIIYRPQMATGMYQYLMKSIKQKHIEIIKNHRSGSILCSNDLSPTTLLIQIFLKTTTHNTASRLGGVGSSCYISSGKKSNCNSFPPALPLHT